MFAEQKQQLESYSKSVADLQAIRDELEGKLEQFREKTSGCQERMNELVQAHQVQYQDEVAVMRF
jgi:FtsZ-binding cell division protein ZapB